MITISQGANFRDGKAAYLFILFLGVLIYSVVQVIVNIDFYPLIFLSPFFTIVLLYILDFRGVQIDQDRKMIRAYKLYLWGKRGDWKHLELFSKISLNYEDYKIETSSPYSGYTNGQSSIIENHHHFVISLMSEDGNDRIVISQENEYVDAVVVMKKLVNRLDLPFEDHFREKLKRRERIR